MLAEAKRAIYIKKLKQLKLAGKGTGHIRQRNIMAINEIKNGSEGFLLGFKEVKHLSVEKILESVSGVTGCSKDISMIEGEGYIDPGLTLDALVRAASIIFGKCIDGKNILLATGHPGAMLGFYGEVSKMVKNLGGHIICPGQGYELNSYLCPNCGLHDVVEEIDYLGGVAVVTNGEILIHTHDTKPMDSILDEAKKNNIEVDLVITDHGFVGSAVKRDLEVIATMDTNDPAIAAAKLLGYAIEIIPMDDNRPNYITEQVGYMLKEIITSQTDSKAVRTNERKAVRAKKQLEQSHVWSDNNGYSRLQR